MEVSGSSEITYEEEKALMDLLHAFGSAFTLEDIASAYRRAGRNADFAGEILFEMQGSSSSTALNSDLINKETSESSFGESLSHVNRKPTTAKLKRRPVSGGTISSVLGKDYIKSVPPANGSSKVTKTLKVDSNELPMPELCGERAKPNSVSNKDMEDFLFKMLGDGYQLSRDRVREVLDICGYDMQESTEMLLDQVEALNLARERKSGGESGKEISEIYTNAEESSQQRKLDLLSSSDGPIKGVLNANGKSLPRQQERNDLEKEVLEALFSSPEIFDESPKRKVKQAKRSKAFGKPVEPPTDLTTEENADNVHSGQDRMDVADKEEEQNSFKTLLRAVQEHRNTWREYIRAAVEAFLKGDQDRANKLQKQVQFFRMKADEANEESQKMTFGTSNVKAEDELPLDLHQHDPREAISLMKCHLSSLAGIPSYLKVILENGEEDITKGARRRLVLKLLKRESISWTEEDNSGTILIRLDAIDRKLLSFAKK